MSHFRFSLSLRERVGVRASIFALFLALSACGNAEPMADAGVDAGTPDAGLTAFQQAVLTTHNQVRASAMPAPSPALPEMHWSTTAQDLAENWAARCVFEHRDPNDLGENIAAGTRQYAGAEVVNDWATEKADYAYSTNTCSLGASCGHYTQVVWRTSLGLGCAQQRCTTNSPFGSGEWFFVVCDYDPAGNYVGQRPY